jgi:zinc protease
VIRRISRFLASLALVAAAAPLAAQASGPKPAEAGKVPEIAFEKYTLSNGLNVILHVDRKLPIVHVNQWYHVGSKNEKEGRTGFAHLFEHMMFQGSKNATGEYFVYAEKAGANLREGGVNGTTNFDRTNYFATVPSGNLENLLWLESDRLSTLLDVTDEKKLDNQRDVVKNERRQGLENQPYGRWFKLVYENVYPAGHPYSWHPIGSQEDLSAASLEDVKEFFRRYYAPNNLSLVIAGDFDPAEAKRLVEKYFGTIPAGSVLLDRPQQFIPNVPGEKIVEALDRVPQERVYMAWPVPEYFAPGEADLELAGLILTDGLASRLQKALVYDKPLATAVQSFLISGEIGGTFVVIATARPGSSLPEIEKIVTEEIGRFAKSGPTPAELSRAKTKQEYNFISGLESIGGFGGKADLLNQYNTFLGDPGMFDEDIARYRAVTVDSMRAAADRWLNTKNRVLVRFRPVSVGPPATVAVDRTQVPALGTDRPYRAPEVKTGKLENGLEVLTVTRPDLPKAAVTLVTRAGSIYDPPGKDGASYLAVTMADAGTKTRKDLEIENALGDLGTTLTATPSRETVRLSFEILKRNLDPAMGVVADVVRNASYPAAEFDREKKRHLDSLSQQAKNPNAIAGRVRSMLAFGSDHPYGRPTAGLPSTVGAISRDDLTAFHARYWKPGSTALIVSGDVTLEEAMGLARKHFGDWRGGAAPTIDIPAPKPAPAGRLYLVDRPDAAQTVVSQFLPAPARKTPDYYALTLADAVWGGGGFGTRLNMNLREEKGYSYGVFSNMALYDQAGLWYAGGGVQTDKTKESIVEFDKELKAIAGGKPISDAEFEAAKAQKLRGYAQQFEALARINQQIGDLWTDRLPVSELQNIYDQSSRVTAEQARAAAQKYALPSKSAMVLVGDRAKIEEGVKSLNLGEVVLLDVEGKPLAE